jgi:Domain of unknown function (DUF4440)
MKRCPTCNRTFTDRNLSFCIDDGTPLTEIADDSDSRNVTPAFDQGKDTSRSSYGSEWNAPPYKAPSAYVPQSSTNARSSWPWIIGILAVLLIGIVGIGIVAAVMVPRVIRNVASRKTSATNVNVSRPGDANVNLNSNQNENSNLNGNSNSDGKDEEVAPPTDSANVLSDLTNLENEWTVANINADKKALDRILADDYVGKTNGRVQGKTEYLRDIARDRSIQKWEFSDLKVNLKGDRATLTGIVHFQLSDGVLKFHFTDKFVWRDGRWQATGSEVSQIQ